MSASSDLFCGCGTLFSRRHQQVQQKKKKFACLYGQTQTPSNYIGDKAEVTNFYYKIFTNCSDNNYS